MRACGGVWVAQASGDADREMSDAAGRIGLAQLVVDRVIAVARDAAGGIGTCRGSRSGSVRSASPVIVRVRPRGRRTRREQRNQQTQDDYERLHDVPPHCDLAGVLADFALGGGFMPGASVASGRANPILVAPDALAEAKASAGTAASSAQLESCRTWRSRARSLRYTA